MHTLLVLALVAGLSAFLFYVLIEARSYRLWELLDMKDGQNVDSRRARPVGQLVAVHSMPPSAGWAPGLSHLPGLDVAVHRGAAALRAFRLSITELALERDKRRLGLA